MPLPATTRLPEKLRDEIDNIAFRLGITRAEMLEKLIKLGLKEFKK